MDPGLPALVGALGVLRSPAQLITRGSVVPWMSMVSTMTSAVLKMIRSRSHRSTRGRRRRYRERGGERDRAPEAGPAGARCATRQPDCAGCLAAVGRRRSFAEPRRLHQDHPGDDDHRGDHQHDHSARATDADDAPHRAGDLRAEEDEQPTVDQEGGEVPERERQHPGPGPDDPRAGVGQHQAGDHHRQHAAGVDELGEQEREERRQHAQRALAQRVVEPSRISTTRPRRQQAGERPRRRWRRRTARRCRARPASRPRRSGRR